MRSMRSMRSMRGGFIFRSRGPWLKVHHGQCLTSMTKHDSGGSRRTTGFEIPGPMTQDRSWIFLSVYLIRGCEATFMVTRQITQLTTARASTYLIAFSTLRRNHHWVVGHRLSGPAVSLHTYKHRYIYVAYMLFACRVRM